MKLVSALIRIAKTVHIELDHTQVCNRCCCLNVLVCFHDSLSCINHKELPYFGTMGKQIIYCY